MAFSLQSSPRSPRGVRSNDWLRESTEDGRVFFFNPCTGASQWHVPNELYKSHFSPRSVAPSSLPISPMPSPGRNVKLAERLRNLGRSVLASATSSQSTFSHPTMMPGSAKARRGVDCVTEFFLTETPLATAQASMMSTCAVEEAPVVHRIKLEEQPAIRVLIKSARGLRDTDFLPGKDKSDPYCVCEVVGKPESKIRTVVVDDCLDPVWEHLAIMKPYDPGDSILLNVYDYDPGEEALGGDDSLGTITLLGDDVLSTNETRELRLNETGKGIEAFITLEISGPCTAWPALTGMELPSARESLASAHPDLRIDLLHVIVPADETYPVVSWDDFHKVTGYKNSFFGAYEDDARFLQDGDIIEFYPKLRRSIIGKGKLVGNRNDRKVVTFARVAGERGPRQMVNGKMVRYVYVKEDGLNVQDSVQWARVPRKCEPGFVPGRVCLYSDPKTNMVVGAVCNG